jgi:hypothetical protein
MKMGATTEHQLYTNLSIAKILVFLSKSK